VLRIEEPQINWPVAHKIRINATDRLFWFMCEDAALDHFLVQLIRIKENFVQGVLNNQNILTTALTKTWAKSRGALLDLNTAPAAKLSYA
jgi:hypothetical protein